MKTLSQAEAASMLRAGGILIFPTETLYALGCDALNAKALARVYEAKRRAASSALPVIIGSLEQLAFLTGEAHPLARELMRVFWPGPLSILFPALPAVPEALCAGTGRVAVRFTSHLAAAALCLAAGRPLVSSSANISGKPAATRPDELTDELLQRADGVYLADPLPAGGPSSSIVEVTDEGLRVVREGAIPAAELRRHGFAVN